MGYITNQWLEGSILRNNRGHWPIEVSMEVTPSTGEWAKERGVLAEVCMERTRGDYQTAYFTQKDLAAILPMLAGCADNEKRKSLALKAISDFRDTDLLEFLEKGLAARARKRRQK